MKKTTLNDCINLKLYKDKIALHDGINLKLYNKY